MASGRVCQEGLSTGESQSLVLVWGACVFGLWFQGAGLAVVLAGDVQVSIKDTRNHDRG